MTGIGNDLDSNPASLKDQAQAMLQQNQLQPAKSIYTRICELSPSDAQAWHMLGMINLRLGNMEEAAAAWRQAITVAPDIAEGHCNLANSLFCLGHGEEAVGHYREALRLKPDYGEALGNMGTVLAGLNHLDEAEQCYRTALGLTPTSILHYHLANVLAGQQRLEESVQHYQQALTLEPKHAESYNNMGNALRHLGRYAEAEECYHNALNLNPNNPMVHDTYASRGTVLLQLSRYDEAWESYTKALEIKPDFPRAVAGQANVLERQGEYKRAYALLQPYLEKDEEGTQMVLSLALAALCHRVGRCGEAIQRIERLLTVKHQGLNVYDHMLLHFTLGGLLDSGGEYDKAFDHYRQANELANRRFDVRGHVRRVESIMSAYNVDFMARAPRASRRSERPVFIVGMPRSGTSLVEQILASHPAVFGAGELDKMSLIEIDLSAVLGGQVSFPRSVESLTADQCDHLSQRYFDYIDNIASPDAQRVTDKMPTNFLRLGLITLLFPQARIIHCVRDPLDTCLSCYFQFFSEGQSFSYDLANLGAYYRQYQRLMEHWRTVLSAPFMEVSYEDLVADQEGVSRSLVEFCGLEWDDRCLRFHAMRRKVATASYDQVRQPMYDRSVGRWRHYDSHLTTLRQALNEPTIGEKQAATAAGADPNVNSAYEIEQRGFEALQAGELDQAKALYSEASRLAPENDEAWYMLGIVNGRLGLLAEAEKSLRHAVAIQPRHAEAHINLGKALEGQGQREEALIHYQEAVQLKPDFAAAHAQTGNLLLALGRHEDALASYRETVRLSPQLPEAHYNLGNALQQNERYAEAITAYHQAIRLKPDFAEAHNKLGLTLAKLNLSSEAKAAFREAVRLRPTFAEAQRNLSNLLTPEVSE